MHYFQSRIFISRIKGIFGIFEIVLGAVSKVLGVGSNCLKIIYIEKQAANNEKCWVK